MKLKCLLEILLEKGYIKETEDQLGEGSISRKFEYEFDEVFKKIKDCDYNKDKIAVMTCYHSENKFIVVNIDNLVKYILSQSEEETFYFDLPIEIIDNYRLFYILKDRDDISIRYNPSRTRREKYIVTNLTIEKAKRIRKQLRKLEVMDFLEQLP